MIKTLYPKFQEWSSNGSIFIFSDTHFEDEDCKLMDPNWVSPEEQISILKSYIYKSDTLIHLGDVGNPEWMNEIPGYKVLITGNHDIPITKYKPYFDDMYTGPLFIAEKIVLSHEPIECLNFCMNIHGHNHNKAEKNDMFHYNVAANVHEYKPLHLGDFIRQGYLSHITSLHRQTIDKATDKSLKLGD